MYIYIILYLFRDTTPPTHPLAERDVFVTIPNKFVQHIYVNKLQSKRFRATLMPDWEFYRERYLPVKKGVCVIGDSNNGPVLLIQKNNLMMACEVNSTSSCIEIREIISTYISHTMKSIIIRNAEMELKGIYSLLFGTQDFLMRNIPNIPMITIEDLSPPKFTSSIRSSLLTGAVFVDTSPHSNNTISGSQHSHTNTANHSHGVTGSKSSPRSPGSTSNNETHIRRHSYRQPSNANEHPTVGNAGQ